MSNVPSNINFGTQKSSLKMTALAAMIFTQRIHKDQKSGLMDIY
jgi:hypothetical protein